MYNTKKLTLYKILYGGFQSQGISKKNLGALFQPKNLLFARRGTYIYRHNVLLTSNSKDAHQNAGQA
jgi:hypothetical protein